MYKLYFDDLIEQMIKQYTGKVDYKMDFIIVYYGYV